MKKIIRLTENDLHRIILETTKKMLTEGEFMDDEDLETQYGKNPNSMFTYGTNLNPEVVSGLDPHSMRKIW